MADYEISRKRFENTGFMSGWRCVHIMLFDASVAQHHKNKATNGEHQCRAGITDGGVRKSDCNGINATVQINSPMVAPPGGKRELRALIRVLVMAGIIAPYEQFIRLYESPNIINSAVAIVVLTGKLKVVAINWSVAINAAGTAAYKINGLNFPLGPIFFRESSKNPVSISVNAVKTSPPER